jgi:hypothetical protein
VGKETRNEAPQLYFDKITDLLTAKIACIPLMDALSLMGTKRTVFLPASCNDRAHETDDCDPGCNQSGISCNDLAPEWNRQLQSACARAADDCDPNRG